MSEAAIVANGNGDPEVALTLEIDLTQGRKLVFKGNNADVVILKRVDERMFIVHVDLAEEDEK